MRVLFIAGSGIGGSNRSLAATINGLQNLGVECFLVVPNIMTKSFFDGLCQSYVVGYKMTIWPRLKDFNDLAFFVPRLTLFLLKNFFAKRKIVKICEKIHPQIIHENISILNVGRKAALHFHLKFIRHIREYVKEDFDYNVFPLKCSFLRQLRCDNTITITKELESFFGLTKNRVIYNGLFSIKEVPSLLYCDNKKNFLFVGQLTPGKGIEFLIDVFFDFIQKDKIHNLLIAGSGNEKYVNSLKNLVLKNNAEKRIVFLGQRDDVPNLMSKSVALVVPSVKEAFGRITTEAMLYGCLVIGKNTGGTKEQFDNAFATLKKEVGFRFITKSELLDCLKKTACLDSFEMKTTVLSARQTVVERYSVEQNVENILNYYNELLAKGMYE